MSRNRTRNQNPDLLHRLPATHPGMLLVWILLGILGARLIYLWLLPLNLSPDESYYWDWSRHLALCYYSKPPMIGWLYALFTGAFGVNDFAARLPAVLFGTVCLWAIYETGRHLYNPRAGLVVLILFLFSPANVALNLLMTIDAPLICFWGITLLCLSKALFPDKPLGKEPASSSAEAVIRKRWAVLGWWALAGFANGLALLTKQTAAAIPVMTGLVLFTCFDLRRHFFKGYVLYGLVILISLTPIVVWNVQHDWVTLQHTSSHFGNGKSWTLFSGLGLFGEFTGSQILLVNPVTFILFAAAGLTAIFHYFRIGSRERFLVLLGPAPLLLIFMLSFSQRVLPNWPAPFYISGLVLLSGWLVSGADLKVSAGRLRSWFAPAVVSGSLLLLLTYAVPYIMLYTPLKGTSVDPTVRLQAWEEMADDFAMIRNRMIAEQTEQEGDTTKADASETFILVAGHRKLVSALAFYMPDHPEVYRWEPTGRILSQYEIWPGAETRLGEDALVIVEDNLPEEDLDRLSAVFEEWRYVEDFDTILGPSRERQYSIYLGRNLRQWPPQ